MTKALAKLGLIVAVGAFLAGPLPLSASRAAAQETNEVLDQKAAQFKDQIAAADLQLMIAGSQRLTQAVQARDLKGSRQAWIETHAIWMRCEAFTADLFPGLDKKINGTEDAKTGFHVIEKGLFAQQPSVDMAIVLQLTEDLQTYQHVFGQGKWTGYFLIASASTYAFAMGDMMGDGGESPTSGTSLADFQHGLDGVERIWKFVFADAVHAKDHFKADEIADQFAALHALLAVPSLDQLPPELFTSEATKLAAELAAASQLVGWRAPDYTDIGE